MNEQINSPVWMTVDEASTYLRVTPNTLYNYMKAGKLPYFYLADTRHRRLKRADVESLLVPGTPNDKSLVEESN